MMKWQSFMINKFIILVIFLLPLSLYSGWKKVSNKELKQKLTPLQYEVVKKGGTERAFKNKYWNHKEEGIYVDIATGEPLFSSKDKFDSKSGWPSFTKPIASNHLKTKLDLSMFMVRTEVKSSIGDSHLGHVFDDGPMDRGGKRYCINSAALKFIPLNKMKELGYEKYIKYVVGGISMEKKENSYQTAYLAGGCFWGVEDLIRKLAGVISTDVGYSGGVSEKAKYEFVKTGQTDHAESIKVVYDPKKLKFEDLLRYFFRLHDPTTKDQQGNDKGRQYRSAIFYQNEEEKKLAAQIIKEVDESKKWPAPVVTTLEQFKEFYKAEEYHQDYLVKNPQGYTCHWLRGS